MPEGTSTVSPKRHNPFWKIIFITGTLVLVGIVWNTNEIQSGILQHEVTPLSRLEWFETRWLYAGLLIFTGSFPVLFGFLPKLNFYREWGRVFLANLPVTGFFILWDIYFTRKEVWGFSETYTSGFSLWGLPWEECLFFLIIPSACTFIYWSLNSVLKKELFAHTEKRISIALILFLFVIGIWNLEHIYTSTASLLAACFLLFHILFVRKGYRGRFYMAYLVSCIPFLLVNGILTGGFTEGPVVMYNPEEFSGIRVGTVPADDFMYSFLMLFANITLFESIRPQQADAALLSPQESS